MGGGGGGPPGGLGGAGASPTPPPPAHSCSPHARMLCTWPGPPCRAPPTPLPRPPRPLNPPSLQSWASWDRHWRTPTKRRACARWERGWPARGGAAGAEGRVAQLLTRPGFTGECDRVPGEFLRLGRAWVHGALPVEVPQALNLKPSPPFRAWNPDSADTGGLTDKEDWRSITARKTQSSLGVCGGFVSARVRAAASHDLSRPVFPPAPPFQWPRIDMLTGGVSDFPAGLGLRPW